MNRLLPLYLAIVIAFSFWIPDGNLFAAAKQENLSSDNESLLVDLDRIIDNKSYFQTRRIQRADSLKELIAIKTGEERVSLLKDLYKVYDRFESDSALAVLSRIAPLFEYEADLNLRHWVNISQARQYAVMGLYEDAFSLLDTIQVNRSSEDIRKHYYEVRHAALDWMADFAEFSSPALTHRLRSEALQLYDTLISFEIDPYSRRIDEANRAYLQGNFDESIRIAKEVLQIGHTEDQRIFSYIILALAYGKKGDVQQEVRYLALCSMADISAGITEYMALPLLAQRLNELGHTQRAYNYVSCSIQDAGHSKAQLRAIQSSAIFPIIDQARRQQDREMRRLSFSAILSLSILLIALIAVIFYLRSQMRKLHAMRRQLHETNAQLQEANNRLHSANNQLQVINQDLSTADKVKEEYIARYLNRCRQYLEALEKYRLQANKLAQSNQFDALSRLLKSDATLQAEQERFYEDFDEAFLNLYPRFIERFNELLKPEARFAPTKRNTLTTELRIFALIRLGVSDPSDIAHFLNYSMATIYNYRSRTRNAAIVSKDEFDKKIQEI